jgi:AMP phosphorylase
VKLKVKKIDYSAGGLLVCVLNDKDAETMDIHANDRVYLHEGKKDGIAVVDINYGNVIKEGEIGLFVDVVDYLNLKTKYINVSLAKKLDSLWYIKKKLEGEKLKKDELNEIVKDIVENRLNEAERTYFVAGCFSNGLNKKETYHLTNAIVNHGSKLNIKSKIILDKHSTGGVAGNRATMIAVPIIAAAGYTIPKTSSRAITSASGTSDTMEVLAKVAFPIKKIENIVKKLNGCLVWGGGVDLASADDKLIKIRRPLSLDPEGLLLASIMAKKFAVGATHVLIDLPYGLGTKFANEKEAKKLKTKFVKLGKMLGMKVRVIISDGSDPVGNGIGPALEARDVVKVLRNDEGPLDLKEKGIYLAAMMLEMVGVKKAKKKARDILESGKAYERFKKIVEMQEGNIPDKIKDIKIGKFKRDYYAKKTGKIHGIDNKKLAKVCRIAGAPVDKGAGVYLEIKTHENVEKGQKLFTVYSNNKKRLDYAFDLCKEEKFIYQ